MDTHSPDVVPNDPVSYPPVSLPTDPSDANRTSATTINKNIPYPLVPESYYPMDNNNTYHPNIPYTSSQDHSPSNVYTSYDRNVMYHQTPCTIPPEPNPYMNQYNPSIICNDSYPTTYDNNHQNELNLNSTMDYEPISGNDDYYHHHSSSMQYPPEPYFNNHNYNNNLESYYNTNIPTPYNNNYSNISTIPNSNYYNASEPSYPNHYPYYSHQEPYPNYNHNNIPDPRYYPQEYSNNSHHQPTIFPNKEEEASPCSVLNNVPVIYPGRGFNVNVNPSNNVKFKKINLATAKHLQMASGPPPPMKYKKLKMKKLIF